MTFVKVAAPGYHKGNCVKCGKELVHDVPFEIVTESGRTVRGFKSAPHGCPAEFDQCSFLASELRQAKKNLQYADETIMSLREELTALRAENERLKDYSDELALKLCDMRDSKNAELTALKAKFDVAVEALEELDCEYDRSYSGVTREVVCTSTHKTDCVKCAALTRLKGGRSK